MIQYQFTNKRVLVTGASRGIGANILQSFVRAGAIGLLHYWDDPKGENRHDAQQLVETLKISYSASLPNAQNGSTNSEPICHLISADVRNAPEVEGMMKQIQSLVGGIDILVNNAGILRDRTLRKLSIEDWHDVMETNLTGVFHCCKYAQDLLAEGGRIINIASIAGITPFHGQSNYGAAKAGVIAFTKVLAKELARRKITANAIAPGVIQTTMLGELKPEVMQDYIRQIPLARLGKPEDVSNAVLFLASEESNYITGQVLPITGGWLA